MPKAYAVAGFVGLYLLLVAFNLGGQLLTNVAGFVIPGYYSLAALFTTTSRDDTQWLTVRFCCLLATDQIFRAVAFGFGTDWLSSPHTQYWVVFAFLTVIESLISVVYWFPFYFMFKLVFLLWLSLPTFRYVVLSVAPWIPTPRPTNQHTTIAVPTLFSAPSSPQCSAVTLAARPLLVSVPRPTASARASKQSSNRQPLEKGVAKTWTICAGHY